MVNCHVAVRKVTHLNNLPSSCSRRNFTEINTGHLTDDLTQHLALIGRRRHGKTDRENANRPTLDPHNVLLCSIAPPEFNHTSSILKLRRRRTVDSVCQENIAQDRAGQTTGKSQCCKTAGTNASVICDSNANQPAKRVIADQVSSAGHPRNRSQTPRGKRRSPWLETDAVKFYPVDGDR